MFCPPPVCTDPNAIDRETSKCGSMGTLTVATPTGKLALPLATMVLSFSSMACQKISVMSSFGTPAVARSMVMVVSVSVARNTCAPMAGTFVTVVRYPTITNVLFASTGVGKVAETDSVAPVIVVMEPVWTLMSAGFVNSITCHVMMWPDPSLFRICSVVVSISSVTIASSVSQLLCTASIVFEKSTNAWFTDDRASGSVTFLTSASWMTSPRWTLTPVTKVTTYHWMLIVAGTPSFVTRSNSMVVHGFAQAIGIRPRRAEATGRLKLWRVSKIRNDFVGSIPEMLTTRMPAVVWVAVPDCTCCATAASAVPRPSSRAARPRALKRASREARRKGRSAFFIMVSVGVLPGPALSATNGELGKRGGPGDRKGKTTAQQAIGL